MLPDLTGARAVVTGASDGVGREIAGALAGAGAEVVMPVRNRQKGDAAVDRIRRASPSARLELRDLDLARLASVRALAAGLVADARPIDLLVLNAGIVMLGDPQRHTTEDGYELHFQTNFLGHAVLTLGILPLLRNARVAVQCSLAAARGRLDWSDLQCERRYTPLRAYASSKIALGLFGWELARRSTALVNVCHPGIAPDTRIAPLVRARAERGPLAGLARHVGNSPLEAAQPALLALTADAASPSFFAPSGFLQISGRAARRRPFRAITDPAEGARVWDFAVACARP